MHLRFFSVESPQSDSTAQGVSDNYFYAKSTALQITFRRSLDAIFIVGDFIKSGGCDWGSGGRRGRSGTGCGLSHGVGRRGGPMPVFDNIPVSTAGYRVCSNTIKSMRTVCLALDLPLDIHPLEKPRLLRQTQTAALIPAKVVNDGPILECLQEGDAVNLEAFPAPLGTW